MRLAVGLENPGDIGRFLLIEATYPKGWIISEAYMRGAWVGTIMGDLKDDGDEWMRFVSLQPGAKTYDLPLFVSSGKSTALYEFPAEGKSTIGDASIDVQCSQGATTLDTQTTHKEYPLAVYKISAEMPKEKITNALDVEPVNVPELRPTGDKDFDSHIGMEKFMHGVEDVKDLHNGRIRITFFMHVPGLRNPSTRLRIVRKDIQRPTITVAIVPAK